ncbi:MAG TPA: ABC transporter permease, partial [bacterium]|nr:ABC transporter permease [bacterium]
MSASLNPHRAASIALKEVRHIVRDPFTLGLALGLPLLMVLFFGVAMDFNVHDIHLTVYDQDRSRASRQLAEAFESSGYFKLRQAPLAADVTAPLDADRAKAVLVIPPRFGRYLASEDGSPAQVLIDGSDNSTAGILGAYLTGIQAAASARLGGDAPPPDFTLKTRYLFNPELNSRWFTVPGLSAVVLAIISILLTALTVAREWENGSMELLLATPARPLEIILGKLAPYVVLGLGAQLLIYLLARFYFGIPFLGSHLVFLAGTFLFLSCYMALGLVISVATRQQMLALQVAMMVGMLPNLILSGFI